MCVFPSAEIRGQLARVRMLFFFVVLGFELRALGSIAALLTCWTSLLAPENFNWHVGHYSTLGRPQILWLALVLGAKYLLCKFSLAFLVEGLGFCCFIFVFSSISLRLGSQTVAQLGLKLIM